MQIFVKLTTGKTITVEVRLGDTVAQLKESIFHREGLETKQQLLTYGGRMLDDQNTLESYGVRAEMVVNMLVRLEGGMLRGACSI